MAQYNKRSQANTSIFQVELSCSESSRVLGQSISSQIELSRVFRRSGDKHGHGNLSVTLFFEVITHRIQNFSADLHNQVHFAATQPKVTHIEHMNSSLLSLEIGKVSANPIISNLISPEFFCKTAGRGLSSLAVPSSKNEDSIVNFWASLHKSSFF